MFIPPPSPTSSATPGIVPGPKHAATPNGSAQSHAAAASGRPLQLVSFNVGPAEYALPISAVQEINRAMPVTPVSACPHGVAGVIHLHGQTIPLVDLRRRFGLEAADATGEQRIIVAELHVQGAVRLLGFVVDKVNRVLRLPQDQLGPASDAVVAGQDAILGVAALEAGPLHLLCPEKLFSEQELAQTQTIANAA